MKLVVINSVGPMATTLVASIIEKYGFISLPIRKRKIHQYLLNEYQLKDFTFKELTIEKLTNLSKLMNTGGVSVVDRDSLVKISRINLDLINQEIESFKLKEFETFEEMYFESMIIANKGTVYKEKLKEIKGSIEITTDITKYNPQELYKQHIKTFRMFNSFILKGLFLNG